MTPGQQLALEQLQRIAACSGALEVLRVEDPEEKRPWLRVEVSVYTGDMPRKAGGLPLRDRERFTLWIDTDFPYSVPSIMVTHKRFAGYPHVSWGFSLCLYQAPQTEWAPSAGMFGLIGRLEYWLRQAAIDQLDPTGGALHPPVTASSKGPLFIPRRDAPVGEGELWTGLIELREVGEHRVDLLEWKRVGDGLHDGLVGSTILLDQPMPLEFPEKLGQLLHCIAERGVSRERVFETLQAALRHNRKERPLYVVVGTPMRGMRGGALRQHLTAWKVDTLAVDMIGLDSDISRSQASLQVRVGAQSPELEAIRARVQTLFSQWADVATVTWCRTREDRPEVTVRRDTGRPASAFAGKRVELWGCGALGGYMGEWLVRAGVAKLMLRDSGVVTPGILVRQPYTDADIGRPKATVLAEQLRTLGLAADIQSSTGDIADELSNQQLPADSDLIIDATASNLLLTKVEEVWTRNPEARRQIASVAIDRNAERLLAVVVRPGHSGGPLDVVRRMKLRACGEPQCAAYLGAFFPDPPPPAFQPEPGCSDATFVGSAVDSAALAAAATNYVGQVLLRDDAASAAGCFLTQGVIGGGGAGCAAFTFEHDVVLKDPQTGYETRIDPAAWRTMQGWKRESQRKRGVDVETGGLLFGEMDEHLRVIWVSEVSGPPPDSRHSAREFVCGIEGTTALNVEKTKRTRKSVQYVGTWHTHPVSEARPSEVDLAAMDLLLTQSPVPVERLLLVIIGCPRGKTEVLASVFLRTEFEQLRRTGFLARACEQTRVEASATTQPPKLGIALSGGGSRAMAFHLGCLRTLHDAGILPKAEVLSTVSGGAVIGAMYAYSDDEFGEFEERVRAALRRGLVGGLARRTVFSGLTPRILATQATAGIAAKVAFAGRFLVGQGERLLRRGSKARGLSSQGMQPPFRRWVSRTSAFEQTLRDQLFGTRTVGSARRHGLETVLNACELRTGTAFRMGSRESGSWRFGVVDGNDIEVATAVAASAAYPALLPAIDRMFSFTNKDGQSRRERMILTDGGVYENLGVSCMTPDKDEAFSTNVFHPSVIICCDAGPGQFSDGALPYGWMTRMRRSFETTHRQVQHGLQALLHQWRQQVALKGFVYSYLGQQDNRLPIQPPDLVRREEVVHYPTDFSPMSDHDIDLLSRRGEQLTRLLLEHYCPTL